MTTGISPPASSSSDEDNTSLPPPAFLSTNNAMTQHINLSSPVSSLSSNSSNPDNLLADSPPHVSSSSAPSSSFVVQEFERWMHDEPDIAIAVAAMQALTAVVSKSQASTMMGLEKELNHAVEQLKARNSSSISLSAGCDLFSRHLTRISLDIPHFPTCVARLVERGQYFTNLSVASRSTIAAGVDQFIRHDHRILIHGFSRVVMAALRHAAKQGKHFSIIVTEGRPSCDGYRVMQELQSYNIECTLILDSAIGYIMDSVDIVLTGAEGVSESGGIINKIGTYPLCVMACAFKRPVYVCAECYKFARLFPLNQRDLPEKREMQQLFLPVQTAATQTTAAHDSSSPSALDHHPCSYPFPEQLRHSNTAQLLQVDNPSCDYTPPKYLTLLFTDLGILTPSAVSDELIKLYY